LTRLAMSPGRFRGSGAVMTETVIATPFVAVSCIFSVTRQQSHIVKTLSIHFEEAWARLSGV
jgi:hypothetical protein